MRMLFSIFVGAFVISPLFYDRAKKAGSDPGICSGLTLVGMPLTILSLSETSTFLG